MQKTPYTISELTRDKAEACGHIVWVEESNPEKAIAAMFNGVNKRPYNAAVWINAATMSPEDQAILTQWRENFYFRDMTCGIPRVKLVSEDNRKRQLSRLFEQFSSLPNSVREKPLVRRDVNNILHCHVAARLDALVSSLPGKSLSMDIRSSRSIKTVEPHQPHIDGRDYDLRFIESLVGPDTLLADMSENTANLFHYWQPPAGSLILLTTESHPWKAIAHASPFTPENRDKPVPRTVAVYDVNLGRKRRFFWG